MIPAFSSSGVLPPFLPGSSPATRADVSPYKVGLLEFVRHFATSPERILILKGYLNYRVALKNIGICSGFQWIDGSFVEAIEVVEGRPPNDIDIVTFADRPNGHRSDDEWRVFLGANQILFSPPRTKSDYMCDAYYVDLTLNARLLVEYTKYWFGLFSHRKVSSLWKGLLQIELDDDESESIEFLNAGSSHAS